MHRILAQRRQSTQDTAEHVKIGQRTELSYSGERGAHAFQRQHRTKPKSAKRSPIISPPQALESLATKETVGLQFTGFHGISRGFHGFFMGGGFPFFFVFFGFGDDTAKSHPNPSTGRLQCSAFSSLRRLKRGPNGLFCRGTTHGTMLLISAAMAREGTNSISH